MARATHLSITRWRSSAVVFMPSLSSVAWHGMENISIRKFSFPLETTYRLLICSVSPASLVLYGVPSSAFCHCYAITLRVLLCTSQTVLKLLRPAYQTRTVYGLSGVRILLRSIFLQLSISFLLVLRKIGLLVLLQRKTLPGILCFHSAPRSHRSLPELLPLWLWEGPANANALVLASLGTLPLLGKQTDVPTAGMCVHARAHGQAMQSQATPCVNGAISYTGDTQSLASPLPYQQTL